MATLVTGAGVAGATGSDQPVPLDPGPLSVLITPKCSATLITKRAAVSSATCLIEEARTSGADPSQVEFRQAIDPEQRALRGRVITFLDGALERAGVRREALEQARAKGIGDLALVLFDQKFPVSEDVDPSYAIPPYWREEEWVDYRREQIGTLGGRPLFGESTKYLILYPRDDKTRRGWFEPGMLYDLAAYFESLKIVRQERDPIVYGAALADLVETASGMRLTDEEIDDLVLPKPIRPPNDEGPSKEPIGEPGTGIVLNTDSNDKGRFMLIGVTTQGPYDIRLSNYWPWIVKTLMKNGRQVEALKVSERVLQGYRTPWRKLTVTGRTRCTRVGRIYARATGSEGSPGELWFYRLLQSPWRDGQDGATYDASCAPFPDAGTSLQGGAWEPLGPGLPSATQGGAVVLSWLYDGGKPGKGAPAVGKYYGHLNPTSAKRAFFKLKEVGPGGLLAPFPLHGGSDEHWEYIGDRVPARRMRWLDADACCEAAAEVAKP